jgi:hypothetical protein
MRSFLVHSLQVLCLVGCCLFLVPADLLAAVTTFKNPRFIPTSSDPNGVVTADVNQDGNADILYVDGAVDHTLHVLLGHGNSTFSNSQDIQLPAGVCCRVTAADVTGDGKLDLIVLGGQQFTGEVAVMPGNGDGTFQAPILSSFLVSQGGFPGFGYAAVGDLNGDGKSDLVLPDLANGQLLILLGDGTGKFTLVNTILTFTRTAVYLADLNGDHHLDMIATDTLGAIFRVFLGNGDGTFQNSVTYGDQTSTSAFLLTDLDGDGRLDMVTQYNPGTVGIFKGNSDGTFAEVTPIGSTPIADVLVGTADFNSDGIRDLLFATPAGTGVELGTGNLGFSGMKATVSSHLQGTLQVSPTPAQADFNNDGFPDLAIPVEGGIILLLGKGDGTFASADSYDIGQIVGAAAVADFNGDTFPDIVVTMPAAFPRLLIGNGQGTFSLGPDPNSSYGSQSPASNIVAADFNGDGKMDIDFGVQLPTAVSLGTQSIAYGLGNGTFTTPAPVENATPTIADFNQDGRSDIVSISGTTATVLLAQANHSFTPVTTSLRLPVLFFGVGDVNGDHKPDLVLDYPDHLEVWLGNGDGTFAYSSSINYNGGYHGVAVVQDLDGDGITDILLAPDPVSTGSIVPLQCFYGKGNGLFDPPISIPIFHPYYQVVAADLDGDGKPELVMTDGSVVAVMQNKGSRTFDSETIYVAGQTISWLNVVDVNKDGYPDIVVANPGGTTVAVLLNEPNGRAAQGAETIGTFTISPEPSAYAQPFTISLAVTGATAGAAVPTGAVSFSLDGGFLANVPLVNGVASYNDADTLIPIQHSIVASYSGDTTYAPRNFSAVHSVQPPTYPTQTALTVFPATLLVSQTVRLTAVVTSNPSVPAGLVTFLDGANTLGTATIDSKGIATHDTGLLAAGIHNLTAKFQGYTQSTFTGSVSYVSAIFAPSTSAPASLTVTSDATTTSISASQATPTAGTVVTFTAKVASPAGVPFGGATYYDGTTMLGSSSLKADGGASFSTTFSAAGSHQLSASFNANGPFAGSSSPPVTINVQSAPASAVATVVSLTPQLNPENGSSRLVALVSAGENSPAGTVTFLDNGVILGSAGADEFGRAQLTVGVLGSGAHRLSASFAGNSDFAPSASPEIQDQWPETGAGYSLSLDANSLHLSRSGSDSARLNVVPESDFAQKVKLSCASGWPEGFSCSFSPEILDGGGSATLSIRPLAGTVESVSSLMLISGLAFGLFAFVLLGSGSSKRFSRGLIVVLCCGCGFMASCVTRPSSQAPIQNMILTIRATSGSGTDAIIHSTQVTLILRNSQ